MVTSIWVYTPYSGTINKQIELAEKFAEIWKKFGAKEVKAVDVDSLAVRATIENAFLNNLTETELSVSFAF